MQLNKIHKFNGEAFKGDVKMASLDHFFGGLSGLVGDPVVVRGSVLNGMKAEHCEKRDSPKAFTRTPGGQAGSSSNGGGGTEATPQQEWEIVVAPEEGRSYGGGQSLREGKPLKHYEKQMRRKNAELARLQHTPLIIEEVVGIRLYTG